MKKLLALVLALVMTLGLATVGANAATFSDDADITYKEAVQVMNAVGVLSGTDGKFNPASPLTREQGAKIITYILLGSKSAGDALSASAAPFDDVAADRWSAGSIQYCAANGIIGGVGGGKFNPEGELTGYAFAKMLLCALGYDASIEGLGGADWQVNTAKLIQTAGLNGGISNFVGSTTVTRDVAAQMSLNALKADMVEYTGGVSVAAGDASVTVASTRQVVSTSNTNAWANAIDNAVVAAGGNRIVQLGEKVYGGDLKLVAANTDFNEPGTRWTYKVTPVTDKKASDPVVTYTTDMSSTANRSTVKSNLSGYTVDLVANGTADSYTTLYINGVKAKPTAAITAVETIADLTANGRTVEIYATNTAAPTRITDIVIKQYDLYKVNYVANNTVSLALQSAGTFRTIDSTAGTLIASAATAQGNVTSQGTNGGTNYDAYEDLSKLAAGDFVQLAIAPTTTAAPNNVPNGSSGNIVDAQPAVKVTGTLSAISGSTYTVGGTAYKPQQNGTTGNFTTVNTATEYDVYLGSADGFILFEEATSSSTHTYARILDTSRDGTAAAGRTYSAKLLFEDGTTKWAEVYKFDGTVVTGTSATATTIQNNFAGGTAYDDVFVEYSENSDNTYNLWNSDAGVAGTVNGTITTGQSSYTGARTYTLNSKTTFLVETSAGSGKYRSYTGIRNIPNLNFTATNLDMYNGDSDATDATKQIAKLVVITGTSSAQGSDSNYLFVYNKGAGSYGEGTKTIYTYSVIKDGVMTTVDTEIDPAEADNALYIDSVYDADGRLTSLGTKIVPSAAGTTTSVLGRTGNVVFYTDGDGSESIALSNGVLTLASDDNRISTATSATVSADSAANGVTMAVSDDFTAWEVTPGSSNTTTANRQITLGAGSATNPATTITNSYNVLFTTNGDGEVNAAYVVKATTTAFGAYTTLASLTSNGDYTIEITPRNLYDIGSVNYTATYDVKVTCIAAPSATSDEIALNWTGLGTPTQVGTEVITPAGAYTAVSATNVTDVNTTTALGDTVTLVVRGTVTTGTNVTPTATDAD